MKDSDVPAGVADLRPLDQAREQKAWYWYDWANSAYVTTIATVLLAPYLIAIARRPRSATASASSGCRWRPARCRRTS